MRFAAPFNPATDPGLMVRGAMIIETVQRSDTSSAIQSPIRAYTLRTRLLASTARAEFNRPAEPPHRFIRLRHNKTHVTMIDSGAGWLNNERFSRRVNKQAPQ